MSERISKPDAARRQLEAAIDLWFADGDALAIWTIAAASFRVLMDIYKHHKDDGFAKTIDDLIKDNVSWSRFTETANFLKHADKDPHGVLDSFDPDRVVSVIGLATLLYKRAQGGMTAKMMAFDAWIEALFPGAFLVEEVDENATRAAASAQYFRSLRSLPREARMKVAQQFYTKFVKVQPELAVIVRAAEETGLTPTQILDHIHELKSSTARGVKGSD